VLIGKSDLQGTFRLPTTPSIANITKGLMKGYISREHQMVVLNKKGAFPGTGV
jgi:hypothetical protein